MALRISFSEGGFWRWLKQSSAFLGLSVAILGGLGSALSYLAQIKADIAAHGIQIKNIADNQQKTDNKVDAVVDTQNKMVGALNRVQDRLDIVVPAPVRQKNKPSWYVPIPETAVGAVEVKPKHSLAGPFILNETARANKPQNAGSVSPF